MLSINKQKGIKYPTGFEAVQRSGIYSNDTKSKLL